MFAQSVSLRISLSVVVILLTGIVQACTPHISVKDSWRGRVFSNANDIIELFDNTRKGISSNDSIAIIENMCRMIWHSGEYIIKCKGENKDITLLPGKIEKISLNNEVLTTFLKEVGVARFADHYFMLLAMKRGCTFDESRDGLTATVFFPIRPINRNDYSKLNDIFSSNNSLLHIAYLEKLKFPFYDGGCTKELYALLPLIEKNVHDCKEKEEILALYKKYIPIMDGNAAPTPIVVDRYGKEHSFSEFRGKVLVVDIWATWCSSCLKKMPAYMQLRNEFKDNHDVEFITLSVDRSNKVKLWESTIDKREMGEMINFVTGTDGYSDFEALYNVEGVPRYMVIDKQGNIVSAYAPGPDNGLRELVKNTLKIK